MNMQEAVNYLESVERDENVLLVHHWDMDGSSSAVIVSKILEEVRGSSADFVRVPEGRKHQIGEETEAVIEEEGVDRLVIVDMSVPTDRVSELREKYGVDILIIDHHDFDEVPEDAVLVNPRVEDDLAYVPASKLCNDISKEFGLDLDWIAGFGIIQDFGVDSAIPLFERLAERYPNYFPEELNQNTLAKRCRYGRYSSVMNIKPYKDTDSCANIVYNTLMDCKGLKYLESQEGYQEIHEYYEEMKAEIREVKKRFDEDKEVYDGKKLVFFEFQSPYHINSSIATQSSIDKEEWIYVIAKKEDGKVNVSARCQSGRLDLGKTLREALPEEVGEEAEAGGHRNAAGASFSYKFLDRFKEKLLNSIDDFED